jgi:hypothetical protein
MAASLNDVPGSAHGNRSLVVFEKPCRRAAAHGSSAPGWPAWRSDGPGFSPDGNQVAFVA